MKMKGKWDEKKKNAKNKEKKKKDKNEKGESLIRGNKRLGMTPN